MKKSINTIFFILLASILIGSCSRHSTYNADRYDEDLDWMYGTWTVINDTDIHHFMSGDDVEWMGFLSVQTISIVPGEIIQVFDHSGDFEEIHEWLKQKYRGLNPDYPKWYNSEVDGHDRAKERRENAENFNIPSFRANVELANGIYADLINKRIYWVNEEWGDDIILYANKVKDYNYSKALSLSKENGNQNTATKAWTERMRASNGLLVCSSQWYNRLSDSYACFVFKPSIDSKDGCKGDLISIHISSIGANSITYTWPELSAKYEVIDDTIYFTNCYSWRFMRVERSGRTRIPDDFYGTWSIKEGVLNIESKFYDNKWSSWKDATYKEVDLHEYNLDNIERMFSTIAKYD